MMKRLNSRMAPIVASIGLFVIAHSPHAAAQALENSAIEQQQGAIQDEITQGITSGTLSAEQIAALQARMQQLSAASAANASATPAGTAAAAGLGRVGTGQGETPVPLAGSTGTAGNNRAASSLTPNPTPNQTGPDPFTYNILGPDAYQSQKYQNPAYNVPAYPTTNPQPEGTQQQYSGPSAGSPYGAGYAQAPGAGGASSQVYVYHPSMSR